MKTWSAYEARAMTRKTHRIDTASVDDGKLAELRRLGREALDRWQRIAGEQDLHDWPRQVAATVDAEALQHLIAEYRRLARDKALDPSDGAEARQQAMRLASM